MMNGEKSKLTPIQEKLLEMLRWYDDFCRKNNLRYYVIGGTMLGAARHQGFIPWDDDIDVGMPRKDYEKLAKLLENKKVHNYILETPESMSNDYCYPFSKIYDTTTTLIENSRYSTKRGLFIDVFPIDGIGNNQSEGRINYKKVKRKYNFYLLKKSGIRKGRRLYKNIAVLLFRIIPDSIISSRELRMDIDRTCAKLDYDNHKWVGNLLGAWGVKEIMEKEIIGTPTEYQFEDIKVFGVEDFERYLTNIYGNWRQLPPKEKRTSHHDFIKYDLNKSFLTME